MTKTFKFGALAAALTMAFAAQAAEVTLYGSVSTGLVYKHTNATLEEGQSKNSYGMESGWYGDSSRWKATSTLTTVTWANLAASLTARLI